MSRIYPDESFNRLESARTSLSRMVLATNIVDFKNDFYNFLESATHSFFPLERSEFNGQISGYKEWEEEKGEFIKQDKLCKFFKVLRNEILKASEDLISWSIDIQELVKIEADKGGVIQLIVQNGGVIIKKQSTNDLTKSENVKDVSGMGVADVKFNFATSSELKNYSEFNGKEVILLSQNYYNILENILQDFIRKFASLD